VLPVIALFLRDRPSDIGLLPYGETGEPKPAPAPKGNPLVMAFATLREAVHVRDFWLLAGTYFACGASTNGLIGTHLIPACIDNGFSEVTGATLLATMGIFNFIGTTSAGWLADRFDNRVLLCMYYGLRGLSLLILPYAFVNFYVLSLFAVFYGLDWFATVSPTVRMITNAFGRDKSGMVYGWVFTAHQMGGASAAFFGGLLRESFGGYFEAFTISGLICLAAAVAALFIGGSRVTPEPAAPAIAKAA
jgi:predicted MFS family arabinose efflux permease